MQSTTARISHVMFDFDGTLSWLRHGWPKMMCDVLEPHVPTGATVPDGNVRAFLLREILSLNGKPSIFQMRWFCEWMERQGGRCPEAEELLEMYQRRLDERIAERVARLRAGRTDPDAYVVHGARALLERLRASNLTLIILSGTVEHRVREEAGWLRLAGFFGPHIYGSTPDQATFSKRQVIERILHEEGIEGTRLLSFGDGPVEIVETRSVGGLAVGVASDEEENGSGRVDAVKAGILEAAGAAFLIPDYRDPETLLRRLRLH